MKKQLQVLLMAFIALPVSAQTQKAINTTGNTLRTNEVTYVYSVGEVTGFSLNQHCAYTQGVIQPSRYSYRPGNFFFFDNLHQISLYPNPTRDLIVIETDYPDLTTYQITAFDGRLIESSRFTYLPINVQRLQSGFYLLTLFSSDYTKKKTFKILKL